MKLEELLVRIRTDKEQYRRDMQDTVGITKKSTGDMGNMFKMLRRTILVLGIGKLIKDSIGQAFEQTEAETKLTTIMRQRMNATDDQINKMKELAKEEQRRGIYGDSLIIQGQQQLSSFLNSTEALETLTGAMASVVAQSRGFSATGGDFVNVANMMGKAIQGQTGALSRVGVTFSEAEANILRTGTEMERAATMAQILTNNFGDMNAALAKTPQGQWAQIKNELADLQKELGYALIPIMNRLIPVARKAIDVMRNFGLMIKNTANWFRNLNPFMQGFLKGVLTTAVALPILAKSFLFLKGVIMVFTKQIYIMGIAINFAFWKIALLAGVIWGAINLLKSALGVEASKPFEDVGKQAQFASDGIGDVNEDLKELDKITKKLTPMDEIVNIGDGGGVGSGIFGDVDFGGMANYFEGLDNSLGDLQSSLDLWGSLKQRVSDTWAGMKLVWEEIVKWYNGLKETYRWIGWIEVGIRGLLMPVQALLLPFRLLLTIGNHIKNNWDAIKKSVDRLMPSIVLATLPIRAMLLPLNATVSVLRSIRSHWDSITQTINKAISRLREFVKIYRPTNMSTGFSSFLQGIRDAGGPVQAWLKGMGFRASGGPVTKNNPYIVGERGPELYIPNQSGSVISNRDMREMGQGQDNSQLNQLIGLLSQDRTVVLDVSGRELAKATFNDFQSEGNRLGKQVTVRRVG